MALIGAKCPECGASLKISEKASGTLICPYCGSEYMVEQAITNITNVNNFNTNVQTNVSEVHNYAGATILGGIEKEFVVEQGVLIDYRGNSTDVEIPEGVLKINAHFNSFINKIILPASLVDYNDIPFDKCEIDISKQPLLSIVDDRILVYNNSEIYGFKDGYLEYHIPNGIAKINVAYPEGSIFIPDSLTVIPLDYDNPIYPTFYVEHPRLHKIVKYEYGAMYDKDIPLVNHIINDARVKFITPIDYRTELQKANEELKNIKFIYVNDRIPNLLNEQKKLLEEQEAESSSKNKKIAIGAVFLIVGIVLFFLSFSKMASVNEFWIYMTLAIIFLFISLFLCRLKDVNAISDRKIAINNLRNEYNKTKLEYDQYLKDSEQNKKSAKRKKDIEDYIDKLINEL